MSILRSPVWKCATIEEIEAEKSLIEKDVVISAILLVSVNFFFLFSVFGRIFSKSNGADYDCDILCTEIKDGKDSWNNSNKFQCCEDWTSKSCHA